MSKTSRPVLVLHRKSANRPEVKEAVKAVRAEGIKLQVRIPWNKKDKGRVVRELIAQGYTRIFAGGGDGTINGVASAIVGAMAERAAKSAKKGGKKKGNNKADKQHSAIAMGILPLGTANDMAHGLGLPCEDLTQCLRIACAAEAKPMDIGLMNGHVFCNVASGGVGAEITATTQQDVKRALGGAAYTLNGLIKIWQMKPYRGSLELPGEAPVEGSMLLMAVGNNRLAGGGFEVAPLAKCDDGLLDLMLVLEAGVDDLARMTDELLDPLNPANRVIRYVQAERFTMKSDRPLHINLDGEPMSVETLEFSVQPAALNVVY